MIKDLFGYLKLYFVAQRLLYLLALLGRQPRPPGALGASLGLYRDSITFTFTNFPPRHAAVKELLTDEYKLYRLAFHDSDVDRLWDSHIL